MLKPKSFRGHCPLDPRRGSAPGPRQGPLSGPLDPTPLDAPLSWIVIYWLAAPILNSFRRACSVSLQGLGLLIGKSQFMFTTLLTQEPIHSANLGNGWLCMHVHLRGAISCYPLLNLCTSLVHCLFHYFQQCRKDLYTTISDTLPSTY